MEEMRTEGSQQASNLVYLSTKQVEQLSDGDKADGSRCSFGQTGGRFSFDIVSVCDTVKDEEEEEGDPFSPTGSETMEEPKNLEPRERRVSDVIDSIGDSLPYTNDHRIVSSPERLLVHEGQIPQSLWDMAVLTVVHRSHLHHLTHMLIHLHPRSS